MELVPGWAMCALRSESCWAELGEATGGPGLELANLSSVGRGLLQRSRLLPRAQGLAWILREGPGSSWDWEG